MKLTIVFLTAAFLSARASGLSQNVSFSGKNVPLTRVFAEVERQTGYVVSYTNGTLVGTHPVTLRLKDVPLDEFFRRVLADQPVKFTIEANSILLSRKPDIVSSSKQKLSNEMLDIPKDTLIDVGGRLTDESGQPLTGVNVVIKGTARGTATNLSGEFQFHNIEKNAVMIVSFVGMRTQEVFVAGRTNINIRMEKATTGMEEVVAVGYGSQKKASLTGSVFVVKMPEIKDQSVSGGNVLKAMDGRMPGAVTSYNGNPNNTASVLMRGLGSLNSSTDPLIIVDGIPTNRGLNELAANDIESIQVLKDASSATIYGSRAANGVYLITTKSAKKGIQVEYSAALKVGYIKKHTIPLMNTEERGRAQWMAARNDNVNPNYGVYSFEDHQDADGNWVLDKVILPEYLDADKTMKPANTDWEKVISRTAISQSHNVTFSNGGEHGSVLLSFDYLKSLGTTKYNEWDRTSFRINSNYKLFNDHLTVGENFSVIKMRSTGDSHLDMIPFIMSIVPVHTIDGKGWGGPVMGMSDRNNPLTVMELNRQNYTADLRLLGSAFADVAIVKNLHFKSSFGLDYDGNWAPYSELKYQAGFMSNTVTKLTLNASYGGSWTWNNVFNYSFRVADNNLQFMVGQEATKTTSQNVWGARDGFASEDPNYLYLDVGDGNVRNGGLAWANSQNSYFGRLNYDYKERYLLTAILRRDGSSRFGKDNVYAMFPSLSAGWLVSREPFMKAVDWISTLKIRYGWGRTGNQAIDNYASYGQYQALYGEDRYPIVYSTAYDLYGADQGNLPSGYRRLQLGNSDLKWETTTQSDLGLDFALNDSKLSGTFDYYVKTTTDILVKPPTLTVSGEGAGTWINGASMKNWGWEAILSYADRIGELGYTISANAYRNKNQVVSLVPEAVGAYPGNGSDQTILGRPLNSLYGYVTDGIFQNQQEVDAHANQPGKGVGRLRYKDLNKDGKIDADDRTWIGVNEPKLSWGLNARLTWKNFDFSMLWNSELGRDIVNGFYGQTKSYSYFMGFYGGMNYGKALLNAWSPTNTKSQIPAISASDNNYEARFSSYMVENTSFMKLQSMSLGYNFSGRIANTLRMKRARAYLLCDNLWTIKMPGNTYTGFDSKTPYENFPIPISITLGLDVTF